MRILAFVLAVSLVVVSPWSAVRAQEPPEFVLPDVVVPGRRPQAGSASPASVTVLTAADLRRLGVRTVGEALAFVPETVARAYGGPGSLVTVSLRGSSAEGVLVLLDGVPINGVLSGNVDLGTIPVDDVERIEVLRGPFSAIYGSGPLGGVVSIVTRRRARPAAAVAAGTPGTASLSVSTGGTARLTLRYDSAAGDRPNSDARTGYLSLRVAGDTPDRGWDLSVIGAIGSRGAPGSVVFPSLTARQDDYRVVAVATATRTTGSVTDRWRLSGRAEGFAFREPAFAIDDRSDATAWTLEWQRVIRASEARVLTLGVDASAQQVVSRSVGRHGVVLGAAYVQDDRALAPRLLVSSGLRVDLHSAYGAQVAPRLGLVYLAGPTTRWRLAVGRTFRGPSIADLYYPFDGFVRGNPALRPEYAWSADAGVEVQPVPGLVVRGTAFWSDVRDLIVYVPDPSFVFSPQNVGAATLWGVSAEAEGAIAPRWSLRGAVTWMQATDRATGLDLPNRPRWSGALALTRALGTAQVTLTAVMVGERFADAGNTLRLPGYMTVGVVGQASLRTGLGVRAAIHNLFDARYESVAGYPSPGRTTTVEVLWQP